MIGRTGILVVAIVVAACSPGASPTPVPPPDGTPGATAVLPSGTAPTASASPAAPSASAEGGWRRPDPATFLQLCDRWPDDVDGDPIPCDELVAVALDAVADDVLPVARVDTSYRCASAADCGSVAPETGYVIVTSDDGAVQVEVVRAPDGSLAAGATAPVDRPVAPPFEAPPIAAPVIELAPVAVNDRVPLPLCGHEAAEPYGPPDTAARECFWNGVRAGSPVELITGSSDTEGRPSTTIYRFAGTGGVEVLYDDEAGWFRIFTGLEPFPDGKVFDLAGLSTAPEAIGGRQAAP